MPKLRLRAAGCLRQESRSRFFVGYGKGSQSILCTRQYTMMSQLLKLCYVIWMNLNVDIVYILDMIRFYIIYILLSTVPAHFLWVLWSLLKWKTLTTGKIPPRLRPLALPTDGFGAALASLFSWMQLALHSSFWRTREIQWDASLVRKHRTD